MLRIPNILWVQPPRCREKTIFLFESTSEAGSMHVQRSGAGRFTHYPTEPAGTLLPRLERKIRASINRFNRVIEPENADTQSCWMGRVRDYYTSFVLCLGFSCSLCSSRLRALFDCYTIKSRAVMPRSQPTSSFL